MPSKISGKAFITFMGVVIVALMVSSALAAPINYIYDDLNRLKEVDYPDGTVIKYEYDRLGNRTRMETSGIPHLSITATTEGNGTISPSGYVTVNVGASQAFTMVPSPCGGVLLDVVVDGVSRGVVSSYIFNNVTSPHSIHAVYSNTLPIAKFRGVPTTGIKSVTVNFEDFSTGNPTSWLWNFGDSLSSSPTSTFQNPTHTYSVVGAYNVTLTSTNSSCSNTLSKTAYVVVQPYVKIAESSVVYRNIQEAYSAAPDGATIQVLSSQYLASQGSDPLLVEDLVANAATPKTVTLEGGYEINMNGQYVLSETGMTIMKGLITTTTGTLIIKNIDLKTQYTYTIVASAGSGGSISPFGTIVVGRNENSEYSMIPLPGYRVLDVLVDGISVGALPSYSFTDITANHSIKAVFSNTDPLPAPSSLSATEISSTRIDLAWIDNSTTETGFIIERKTGVSGTYSQIAVTGPGITGYFDTSVIKNTAYYYRVRAFTALKSSVYSAEASATTADITPPTCLIVIAGGAMVSSSPTVTLTLSSQDDSGQVVNSMQFSNDGATWSSPEAYATIRIWTLSSGNGVKTVYAKFQDQAGIWSDACFDVIALNRTLTLPMTIFMGLPTTGLKTVAVHFEDSSTANPTSWFWNFGDSLSSSPTSTFQNPTHTYSAAGKYTVTLTSTNADGSNTLTKNDYIIVQPYVKIAGSSAFYRSIQEAYNVAPDGATIQVLGSQTLTGGGFDPLLVEDLVANAATPKTITLEGGYDLAYSSATGMTTMKGSITTTTGTLTIKNIDLRTGTAYKITATAGEGGSISPSGTITVNPNTNMEFGMTPLPGYRIADVKVDGSSVGAQPLYSLATITGNHNIVAEFSNTDPLPAPSSLTVAAFSSTGIDLAWMDNSTTETGFIIDRKTGTGGTYSQIALTGPDVTGYSDTGLTPNTVYYYRVRAITALSSSVYSAEANATTPDINPPTCSIVIANGAEYVNITVVTLSLNSQDDSKQVVNSMQFSNDEATWSLPETYATVGTWTLPTGDGAKTVYAKFQDQAGNWSDACNDTIVVETTPPTAPADLTTTATSTSQISLSWTVATDNVEVTGYQIERCQGAGCSTFSQIATTTTTTYNNTGLMASTSYSYRVRATDAANNLSPYSGISTAITPAAPLVRVNKLSHISGSVPVGKGSQTTASFTPANNSLLLAVVSYTGNNITTDKSAYITIAGGGLTWTRSLYVGTGTSPGQGLAIFTAPVATGASMSLTLGTGGSNSIRAYGCQVFQYTNYNTSTPVGATATTNDAVEDGAQLLTLSATPASTSEVLGFYASYPITTVATTEGSGWTELYDAGTGGYTHLHSQAKMNVGSTTVPWTDVAASGTQSAGIAAAIEIKALQ